ncbi:uncharacterized protein L201_003421 [Kwoniella dendrophila CBS 6074]|uniref:Uncharacterized protein n=1 Tax=Kwoniella dendrophila CBS 6074 TaxID=1295534 RepID=A0AAX4JSZ4_9TREE
MSESSDTFTFHQLLPDGDISAKPASYADFQASESLKRSQERRHVTKTQTAPYGFMTIQGIIQDLQSTHADSSDTNTGKLKESDDIASNDLQSQSQSQYFLGQHIAKPIYGKFRNVNTGVDDDTIYSCSGVIGFASESLSDVPTCEAEVFFLPTALNNYSNKSLATALTKPCMFAQVTTRSGQIQGYSTKMDDEDMIIKDIDGTIVALKKPAPDDEDRTLFASDHTYPIKLRSTLYHKVSVVDRK